MSCYRNHGKGKRQVTLEMQNSSLFSTYSDSAESPPEGECTGFVLTILHGMGLWVLVTFPPKQFG